MLLPSRGPIPIYANSFTGANGSAPADFTGVSGTMTVQGNAIQLLTGTSALDACAAYCTKTMPKDYDLRVDMDIVTVDPAQFYGAINVRAGSTTFNDVKPLSSWHLLFEGSPGVGQAIFYRIDGAGAATFLSGGGDIGFVMGSIMHVRLRVVGSVFKLRMWKNSEVEPTAWNLSFDDGVSAPTGTANSLSFGIRGGSGSAVANDWRWDTLTITDLTAQRGVHKPAMHSARM